MTPSPKIALIQLISEQTIQNLLPINALQPQALLHLATAKTALRSTQIKDAALASGIAAKFENIRLSDMPSIPETSRTVSRCILAAREAGLLPVVNFTGGTKLMSIGAYQEAARSGIPSFYVDTQSGHFLDAGTGQNLPALFGGDLSFSNILANLTLDMMVVANGHRSVSAGRDWRHYLAAAQAISQNPEDAAAMREALSGRSGLIPEGREPRKPYLWLPILPESFFVPETILPHLLACGLVQRGATIESARLPNHTLPELTVLSSLDYVEQHKSQSRYFAAIQPVQQTIAFLGGGWWEVIVAEAMDRSGRFQDLRWSANITQQSGVTIEEDILAINGADAVCVSCKTGGSRQKLLPHLEELSSRAKAVGGNFTRPILAVQQPYDRMIQSVLTRAKELRIRILTPEILSSPEAFA
ncbi:MAG: DUF1887 family CARF protein [Verrucomicrobiota bacterium]